MQTDDNITTAKTSGGKLFASLIASLSIVLTVLVMLPLKPLMPTPGLDTSWAYALNDAVARHLVFGRDLIFTFGPLGSAYTWLYHPATDALMMASSLVVAVGFCAGFALLMLDRHSKMLVVLPLIVVIGVSRDADLMALPLCFLLATFRVSAPAGDSYSLEINARIVGLLTLLACGMGILPLIKGSLSGTVILLCLLSFVMLVRSGKTALAVFLAGLMIVSMCAAWLMAGQPALALPGFFLAQAPIISGYTDAMSLDGDRGSVVSWALPSILCVAVFYISARHRRIDGLIATAGVAAYLFIAFKSGFVRQDAHPRIAICSTVLACFAVSPMLRPRNAFIVGLFAIAGWTAVEREIEGFQPEMAVYRVSDAALSAIEGIRARFHHATLDSQYDAANQQIRENLTLPYSTVSTDLYPTELSAIFANGLKWDGRPVLQSYSAYTPGLADLNLEHLKGDAPSRIFFSIGQTTDYRYPALEDGASWPKILSDYRASGFVGEYAILDRGTPSGVAIGQPFYSSIAKLGEMVPILSKGAVWAEIDVEKTAAGKLVSALYKNPLLYLVVQYPDGSSKKYRFIPGMAKNGFLLSPTISTEKDFVALTSRFSAGLMDGKYPSSFGVVGSSGTRFLWKIAYAVRLSPITIEPKPGVDDMMLNQPVSNISVADAAIGGDCSTDAVNGHSVTGSPIRIHNALLNVSGWAMLSGKEGRKNNGVFVALTSADGNIKVFSTQSMVRDDVAAYFHHPEAANVGYSALIDTTGMGQNFTVRVIQKDGPRDLVCGSPPIGISR